MGKGQQHVGIFHIRPSRKHKFKQSYPLVHIYETARHVYRFVGLHHHVPYLLSVGIDQCGQGLNPRQSGELCMASQAHQEYNQCKQISFHAHSLFYVAAKLRRMEFRPKKNASQYVPFHTFLPHFGHFGTTLDAFADAVVWPN